MDKKEKQQGIGWRLISILNLIQHGKKQGVNNRHRHRREQLKDSGPRDQVIIQVDDDIGGINGILQSPHQPILPHVAE